MMSGTKTLCGPSDVLLGAVSVRDEELLVASARWGTHDVAESSIRYSAGIEDPDDLVAELLPALKA